MINHCSWRTQHRHPNGEWTTSATTEKPTSAINYSTTVDHTTTVDHFAAPLAFAFACFLTLWRSWSKAIYSEPSFFRLTFCCCSFHFKTTSAPDSIGSFRWKG